MLKISNSSLRDFQTCPKKWAYRYIHNRVPLVLDEKLYFGKAIHKALEIWWDDGPILALAWLEEQKWELDPLDLIRARVTIQHYNPPSQDYRLIASEVPFSVTVKTPNGGYLHGVRLIGFIDSLLLEKKTDRLIVREAKTTAMEISGFGPYWARMAVDPQISTYHLAANADGVIYDVMKRASRWKISQADIKTAAAEEIPAQLAFMNRLEHAVTECPENWYQWRPIWKTEEDRQEAQLDLYYQVRTLRNAVRENYFPKHGNSCGSIFGKPCPYLDVCTGRASLDDNGRFQDRPESPNATP